MMLMTIAETLFLVLEEARLWQEDEEGEMEVRSMSEIPLTPPQ